MSFRSKVGRALCKIGMHRFGEPETCWTPGGDVFRYRCERWYCFAVRVSEVAE